MTPAQIIPEVRDIIKDDDSVAYRNVDGDIVLAVNRALKRIALLRPDLFTTIAPITLTAGILQQFRIAVGS